VISASPIGRLLAAHWALWAVVALFLLVGAFAFDDYGLSGDSPEQRAVGMAALDYLAGDGERAFERTSSPHDRYFGAALEAPLAFLERLSGLESSRNVYLGRHVLTHLFFLAGGVFCYLLVLRMFDSRALALIALALFLLHPRIYAHSFYNSKDAPFLATFMISLYLAHRAFRRDSLGAFLLCGVGVALLVNLRVMGVVLFVAVLALRALDLAFAGSATERGRVWLSGGAFALAAILAWYALSPVLWTDPFGRFVEMARVLRSHPLEVFSLFRGELLYSPDGPPWDYVPVWIGITTPPATLLLALAGTLALAWRGLRRPRDVLRNGPLRFGFLLLALPVATTVAVVVLRNNIYDDWRHLFFLYAPLLLLAVMGLRCLRGRGWMRAGAYALAGAAIAIAVVSMVRIHPHQNSYFNLAVDRTTPERPGSRYGLDYWEQSVLPALAAIVEEHPSGPLFADVSLDSAFLLAPGERERFTVTRNFRSGQPNFLEFPDPGVCPLAPASPSAVVHAAHVYAAMLHCVVDPVAWFGDVRREALAAGSLARSVYDIRRDGRLLTYVRDGCPPGDVTAVGARFFLHVAPRDPDDLPRWRRKRGLEFDNLDAALRGGAARIDGNCVAVAVLPDYPIAGIRTGQFTDDGVLWEVRLTPGGE